MFVLFHFIQLLFFTLILRYLGFMVMRFINKDFQFPIFGLHPLIQVLIFDIHLLIMFPIFRFHLLILCFQLDILLVKLILLLFIPHFNTFQDQVV